MGKDKEAKKDKLTQGNSDHNFERFSAYTHLNPPPPPKKKQKPKYPNKLNNNKQTKKREEILTDKGHNIMLLTQSAHFICLRVHTKKN